MEDKPHFPIVKGTSIAEEALRTIDKVRNVTTILTSLWYPYVSILMIKCVLALYTQYMYFPESCEKISQAYYSGGIFILVIVKSAVSLVGFEPTTLWLQVLQSNHWTMTYMYMVQGGSLVLIELLICFLLFALT